MDPVPNPEMPTIPRWAQVTAGIVLLPLALLCVVGAVSIFGIPKVQGDPVLQLFAALWSLLCLWAVVLSVRLILGLRGRFGFFGRWHCGSSQSLQSRWLSVARSMGSMWRIQFAVACWQSPTFSSP